MLQTVLIVFQIIVCILLVGSILLQAPEGGLSPAFGGGGEMYRSRQNVEKFLIWVTVILSVVLVALAILLLFPQGR